MSLEALKQHDKSNWQDIASKITGAVQTRHFIDGDFVKQD